MIEWLASYLATRIRSVIPEHASGHAVLQYGLIIIINLFITLTLALFIGGMMNELSDTLIGILTFALLRAISGGFHLNTSIGCMILSVCIFTIIPLFSLSEEATVVLSLISLILFLILAPANLANQSRISPKHYPVLKVMSCLLVVLSYFVSSSVSSVITLAVFIQALSLISPDFERR